MTVTRNYSYWQIDNLEVYGIAKSILNNYSLAGDTITLTPNGYTKPTVDAVNSDAVTSHVFPKSPTQIPLGSQDISNNTRTPSLPNYRSEFQAAAENETKPPDVKNDKVVFNGSTLMSDQTAVETAPSPTAIPAPKDIRRDVLYKNGLMIPINKENKANTPITGTIDYNLTRGIKGGSAKQYNVTPLNTVTVHTPVVNYSSISDDRAHNQKTKPAYDRSAVILDRPFTITIPNSGQYRNIPGYGNRDYTKWIGKKEVFFPFDVYYESTFYLAKQWINLPINQETYHFFLPVWVGVLSKVL